MEELKEKQGMRSISMGDLVITLHRTCRVPRLEGKTNSLPAGLGAFPIYRVEDFENVPEHWKKEGHFTVVYKHEALWIGFNRPSRPIALIIGAGMVNAITGERLVDKIQNKPEQNYLVVPPQPWIDGFKTNVGGKVYQFVGANLGEGETAEEQILGTAEFGGLQFAAFDSKVPLIPAARPFEHILSGDFLLYSFGATRDATKGMRSEPSIQEMGLGAGGAIEQKIYEDPYLVGDKSVEEIWKNEPFMKAYIYMVDPKGFEEITGQKAPPSPITYETYQRLGLPWFGLFDEKLDDVPGAEIFDKIKPVGGNPDPVIASEKPVEKEEYLGEKKKKEATLKLW